jgi:hypothetical protein
MPGIGLTGGGPRKGSVQCGHTGNAGTHCRKWAHVAIHVRVEGASVGSEHLLHRCWVHYIELENACRSKSNMTVLRAEEVSTQRKPDGQRARA